MTHTDNNAMEPSLVIEALKATIVAENQEKATDYLKGCSNVAGFPRLLFQLAISGEVQCAVKQAAVIYLKDGTVERSSMLLAFLHIQNLVSDRWAKDKDEETTDKNQPLGEEDKEFIRQQILQAIVHAPEPIRVHLCVVIQYIMREEFPSQWPGLVEGITNLLHANETESFYGALIILHRLSKIYEYKRNKEKAPLIEYMRGVLPFVRMRFTTLLNTDASVQTCLLQKLIMKILYSLIQFSLSTDMISTQEMDQWIRALMSVVERPVPQKCLDLNDKESMEESVWWKCKKWALKIVARVFERYGSKGQVEEAYTEIAEHFTQELAVPIAESIMKSVLNDYVLGRFVTNHVLYLAMGHLAEAVSQAQIWKVVKPHWQELLKTVIFPLLMYSEEDEEMWDGSPEEFIASKYDAYEDMHTPCAASGHLLQAICRRGGILQPVLEFILAHLQAGMASARDIDAVLHMVGLLSPSLNRSKKYKKDVEKLLHAHILPKLGHESKFIRYRACYVAKCASDTSFRNNRILAQLVSTLVERLALQDEELPVKVEAALALQALMTEQDEKMVPLLKPHVRTLLVEVLRLISRTRLDDLPPVVDSLLESFEEDVIPIAHDIIGELLNIFYRLSGVGPENTVEAHELEDNTVAIMGVLSTLETVLTLIEDHHEVIRRVEPQVRQAIFAVFENECVEYYEEMLSVAQSLIAAQPPSPEMWRLYELVYKSLVEEKTLLGSSFLIDCAPVLHSFLTLDPAAFLGNATRMQAFYTMCAVTLENEEDVDEQAQTYAAKLLEVFLLQYKGFPVDSVVQPILQLVAKRFSRTNEDEIGDLRPQLLLTMVSAFYYDERLFFNTLPQSAQAAGANLDWLTRAILAELDHFEGVHSRKLLIFFFCRLVSLPLDQLLAPENKIRADPKVIMETLLKLFDGLQKCLKAIAENERDDDDDSSEASDESENDERMGELRDSDDDIDEGTMEYLDALNKSARRERRKESEMDTQGDEFHSTSEDSESHHHFVEETEYDSYEAPLDKQDGGINVFLLFKQTFQELQTSNTQLFSALSWGLVDSEKEELQKLMVVCDQQEALVQSQRVSDAGGYQFDASAPVANSFTFSS